MDYIKPVDLTKNAIDLAAIKASLSINDLFLRGILSGAILGIATTLAYTGAKQTGLPLVGALIFPVGFVLIALFGFELVTGNFVLLPMGVHAGQVTISGMLRNFTFVFLGNLVGSLLYGYLFVLTLTLTNTPLQNTVAPLIIAAAEGKTNAYAPHGAAGMLDCLIKAILCNWMVCFATLGGMTSTASIGKMLGAAIPIFIFFAQGFEHSVVNMFVIPAGMMLGAKVSFADWWLWNQIPVTIGNFLAGWLTIGLPMFLTYGKKDVHPAAASIHSKEPRISL
jgi:formate/nitrite transporter